jgi:hypothetical protein
MSIPSRIDQRGERSMSVTTAISAFAQRSVRRREAVQRLIYSAGMSALVLLCSSWLCSLELRSEPESAPLHSYWQVLPVADLFALATLAVCLLVLAPAVVAATVAAERRAGTLDQLRTTPLAPLALTVGLVVGAPIRLYLLCAGPLALHMVAGLTGAIGLDTLVATTVVLAAGSILSCLVALNVALAPRQDSGGAFVALHVAALLGLLGVISVCLPSEQMSASWAFLHPAGALQAVLLSHDGLWRRLIFSEWSVQRLSESEHLGKLLLAPLLSTAMSLAGSFLLARAACRKLAAPHVPLLSKPQALALFGLAAAAVILPIPVENLGSSRVTACIFAFLLLPVAALLGGLATPTFESWAMALRRGGRVAWWRDEAGPHVTHLLMMGALAALLWLTLHDVLEGGLDGDWPLACAWMVSVFATVPIYTLFGFTRYSTPAARFGFGAAVLAHLIVQLIGIVLYFNRVHEVGLLFVEVTAVAGVMVPLWVWLCQRRLARRTLDGKQPA